MLSYSAACLSQSLYLLNRAVLVDDELQKGLLNFVGDFGIFF